MSIEHIPNSDLSYHLVCFDAGGKERQDDPDGIMSEQVLKRLRDEPITDVFLLSHGWKGDVAAARKQYGDWIGAAAGCADDLALMRKKRPGFAPLMVGLHWPSLPFGDEDFGAGTASFGLQESGSADATLTVDGMVERFADRIADTPAARVALHTIFEAALDDMDPAEMPPAVRDAYQVLNREANLGATGAAGAPGADREPFDAEAAFQNAKGEAGSFGFGSSILSGLLSPLVQLSFWKMKARACSIGEGGCFQLVTQLQQQTQASGVRFHLMGHSFGCIVVSATVAGPAGAKLPRPIDSMFLAQGALSLWSYCQSIPSRPDQSGYFYRMVQEGRVAGPIVTTISEHDSAVGRLYPLAAGVAGQVAMAPGDLPKFGAVGTCGLRGAGIDVIDLELPAVDQTLTLAPQKIYNLECSHVIRTGGGMAGAHNDISHPELAHAFWTAAMATL